MSPSHCETALQRIQKIVTTASKPDAPITEREAYEQIVEELELAGFGATCPEPPADGAGAGRGASLLS